jgi:hypothetical protein
MKSMELTKEESAEMTGATPMKEGDGPKYPYGLCLYLCDDTLEKLGVAGLPEVGSVMKVTALATVTSIGMNQQKDGDKESRAELQITDMEMVKAGKSDLAKSMYPDMD